MTDTRPLLAEIIRLKSALAEIPHRLDLLERPNHSHKRDLLNRLQQAKDNFITAEIANYLAGEDERPVAQIEAPLTSAAAMATVFECADRIGVMPFPRTSTDPLPAPSITRRDFVTGGEYRA
jgi:hypothetical protein